MREKQRKSIDVDPGLYLVRYATAEDKVKPPIITLSPHRGSERVLQMMTHPGEDRPVLWQPGACLVMRASAAGKLDVEVDPAFDSTSAAASVRVEPLSQGRKSEAPNSDAARAPALDMSGFSLVGHVAGVGDVRVESGEWLAGPATPSRVEGISVEWPNKPNSLEVRYSVTTARPHPVSQRMVRMGEYAGTRGKALAVVGVALEMAGSNAGAQFSVEAIFLGSPAVRKIGRRLFLEGPTGREPLVGLKVAIEETPSVQDTTSAQRSVPQPSAIGRVRVFRARNRVNQEADDSGRKLARPA
jgi:hypothetical protein